MKISKKDYLQALNLIRAYRRQLKNELDEINKSVELHEDEFLNEDDEVVYNLNDKLINIVPVRLLNIIATHCGNSKIEYRRRKATLTVKDLLKIDLDIAKTWRGLGPKSLYQLKTIVHRARKSK